MEKEERVYSAYKKFGSRLAVALSLCLERVQRGDKVKQQMGKGRKLE